MCPNLTTHTNALLIYNCHRMTASTHDNLKEMPLSARASLTRGADRYCLFTPCTKEIRLQRKYPRILKNTFFVSNFLSIEPCRFYNIIRRSAPIFCQRSASAQGDFSKSLSAHAKVFHQIYAFIGSKKTWQNFQSKTARDEKYSTPSFTPKKFSLNVFVQKSFPHCRCSRPGPGVAGANWTYKTERYYI